MFGTTASAYIDEGDFFSYERFFLRQGLIDRIPSDGKTKSDLNRFAVSFTDGIYAISSEQLDVAEKKLIKAREIWPEYFGSDFLLARVYEEKGDYQTAARYYKSYLNKLKALQAGQYRISESLIRSITPYRIEQYEPARELVKERLASYGIDLDKVWPIISPPEFFLPLIIIIALIIFYGIIRYLLYPYFKKRNRIKHPPDGFWACRYCAAYNPDTAKVCGECDRSRE